MQAAPEVADHRVVDFPAADFPVVERSVPVAAFPAGLPSAALGRESRVVIAAGSAVAIGAVPTTADVITADSI